MLSNAERKELFFYGAGYGDYFRVGMAALHGPELPLELPLEPWQEMWALLLERPPAE